MAAKKAYLAIDMGASSGRHVIGTFDGKKLNLEEVYRFENGAVELGGSLFWDLPGLWSHVKKGMRAAAVKMNGEVTSVGVDTWGVDFALLGRDDTLLGNPYQYRDARTDGMMDYAFSLVPREEIFRYTGLQFLQFNSLFQLLAMKKCRSPILEQAESFLMVPDIFHWLMTGVKVNEFTEATTSQMFDPTNDAWAIDLLRKLGLPTDILQTLAMPGTDLGGLRASVIRETGLKTTKVVLPATHDTGSAVAAVPAKSVSGKAPNWAYVSLGTWALMGVESPVPVVTPTVSRLNFTNEGGVGKTYRILKNICGLWLVQECRRVWNLDGRNRSWEDLNQMTRQAKPLRAFINPDARDFLGPTDMPEAIRECCRRTGQVVPETEGEVIRCALDSIAMKFRQVLEMCEQITGERIETIHIVGGGIQNRILCQAAADATGRLVVTGPIEGTGIGNVVVQAIASGEFRDLAEAREVIRDSFPGEEYAPQNVGEWNDAYARFLRVA
ncbi:MAG: rhamnulokinase family protein [Planctomycetia bacterium]|nr:rhamnulokinase family protein [Planctomycetia bacterium]